MKKLVIITHPEYVDGYRLAGVEAIGMQNAEGAKKLISTWIEKGDEVLLALDDSFFSSFDDKFTKRIYEAMNLLLVTIPDGPITGANLTRQTRIHNMIRNATGVQIRFKGENNGKR